MAIESGFLVSTSSDKRYTLTYPMLARGAETGAIYLMLERLNANMQKRVIAICVVPGGGVAIGEEYPSTAGKFIPLAVAESIIMTQVKG